MPALLCCVGDEENLQEGRLVVIVAVWKGKERPGESSTGRNNLQTNSVWGSQGRTGCKIGPHTLRTGLALLVIRYICGARLHTVTWPKDQHASGSTI